MDMLEERLQKLEASNRRLRWGLCAAVVAWPLVAATGADSGKTLEVERIVVRDAKKTVRAELGTQPDGSPVLTLLDPEGRPSLALRGAPAGPILELADGQGGSAWLSSSTTGASLTLSKNKGEIELATRASGYPLAQLRDKDGKVVWEAPAGK